MTDKTTEIDVVFFDGTSGFSRRSQPVIRERPVSLHVNGNELVTLLCTGHHLQELAAGFLYAEGFLRRPEDLGKIEVDEELGRVEITCANDLSHVNQLWTKRTVTSGCGKGTLFSFALDALRSKPVKSTLRMSAENVVHRMEDLHRLSDTYRQTHGVHNTALSTPKEILVFRDDIGRHNAVDMIVGHCFLNAVSLQDKLLVTTGRLTSEMLIKAAKVGIPVIVSRNTATTLAIELAKSLNITLIGHVRAGKFIIYAGEERIETS
ncbi:formate dehydrogenase accessory sulfurtransferase FdhD [Desulfatirhabdium butyrativorans]|uniref:formate dehydrogenase accessory sulfurtransferase FdhD n=1 Tax=Desulfatirhabdium butyrativorans TaxID=340467 RepID=UPI0003FBE0AF|nr:formate dehydrogenase accessory sulfurtransferase FdhD [Desulfatirhabdium butyrativorans]